MKGKKIISLILTSLFVLGSTTCLAAATDESQLSFNDDGKFTVLHITDIQDRYPINYVAKKFLIDTVDKVKPDLIVLGGDNIAGNVIFLKSNISRAINEYMSIFEERGIKVASVFGNHDAEGKSSTKQGQMEIYKKYNCYIGTEGFVDEEDNRVGTYNLPIMKSDGSGYGFNLWLIDSGDYNEDNEYGGYDYVTDAQIQWYKETAEKLKEENGGEAVPSILFQHIIVPEIFEALKEVDESFEGAVSKELYGSSKMRYFTLDEGSKGELGEAPCPSNYNNGQFDAMVETGDVLAAVFGHDHRNSFEVKYKGIDLINTPSMSFSMSSYNGTLRGTRVFVLDENKPEEYETYVIDYDDIYSDDDKMMKNGFAAYDRDNEMSSRIKCWFAYRFSRFGNWVKGLFS